ncbi:MAG: hypothetical protein V2I65_13250 [Paracoccaceae bacterium]|jgi:hypothetical protein|nr:hypothetical protein [Paracoccaceae bacterium]
MSVRALSTLPGPCAPRLRLPERSRFLSTVREALVSACIVGALAVAARAEVTLQDWIPGILAFPEDAEVLIDREIGSSVRMFSFATTADTGPMLADWERSLRDNGFTIEREADELVDGSIEFSGPGIANAKIVATRRDDAGASIVEFDATLD